MHIAEWNAHLNDYFERNFTPPPLLYGGKSETLAQVLTYSSVHISHF